MSTEGPVLVTENIEFNFEKRPSFFNNGHAQGNFAVDGPAVKTQLFKVHSNVDAEICLLKAEHVVGA